MLPPPTFELRLGLLSSARLKGMIVTLPFRHDRNWRRNVFLHQAALRWRFACLTCRFRLGRFSGTDRHRPVQACQISVGVMLLALTHIPPRQPPLHAMTWIDPEDFRRRFGSRQLSMAFCQVLSSEEVVGRTEVEVGVDGLLVGVADEGRSRCQALKVKCEWYSFVRR